MLHFSITTRPPLSIEPFFYANLWIYVEIKRKRKEYEKIKGFQDVWNVKTPRTKSMVDEQGKVHKIICKICTKINRKEKLLVPKLDNL
jgi:hypothetical protein